MTIQIQHETGLNSSLFPRQLDKWSIWKMGQGLVPRS